MSDDEAYYWVLAQRPALGYAYHPPAVAWIIALFDRVPGIGATSFGVRLPAAAMVFCVLILAYGWVRNLARDREREAAWSVLALPGIFALSWMMVPDVPLLLGWTLAFVATWKLCPGLSVTGEGGGATRLFLALGIAIAILSKYSGVLVAFSAAVSLALWGGLDRRRDLRAVLRAVLLALVPILIWNALHGFESILYQLRDRHQGGGGFSAARGARFWLIQLLIAGPPLLIYLVATLKRWVSGRATRVDRFVAVWMLPAAAAYFTQPFFADFKPHWALIAWWPLILGWAASGDWPRLLRAQRRYALVLTLLVALCVHLPVVTLIGARFAQPFDPRWDVSNDFYGWSQVPDYLIARRGPSARGMPWLGGRYQTASQLAFATNDVERVTLWPLDSRARGEWAGLREGVDEALFVADNRYDAAPDFPGYSCVPGGTLEVTRLGLIAKRFTTYRCLKW